jgi:ectoine hydroxylase-related dioxygenase (phytanoyl-CoA dioxygenase family)
VDRDKYRDQQFLGPIELMSAEQMVMLRPQLERVLASPGLAPAPSAAQAAGRLSTLVAGRAGQSPVPFIECRHLDSRAVYDLCANPRLIGIARALYGDDLLLWRSTFIEKAAGGPVYRWHQDWGGVYGPGDEYGVEPPMLFTAWIAISAATEDNGCLRFVPGIRRVIPAEPAAPGPRATMLIPDGMIDESRAVAVPLLPGQCVVFTDRAVHTSGRNTEGEPRLGIAVRFTLPAVRVRPHFPGHACVLVSGRDSVGVNSLVSPPGSAS